VPINYNNVKEGRKGVLLIALAGPAANILTAFITMVIIALLSKLGLLTCVWSSVLWLTFSYNIVFGIFNLIPVPPLDGSKVLSGLLPGRQAYAFERLEPYGPIILIALVSLGLVGTITYPLEAALSTIIRTIVAILI
jgi:Zn-dependent protease